MTRWAPLGSDVFTPREIARAAGATSADVEALFASGAITAVDGRFADAREAVRAVLLLRGSRATLTPDRQLFRPLRASHQRRGTPLTVSGLLHLVAFGLVALTTLGVASRTDTESRPSTPTRMVFLVQPGPGGGGGGGGLRQPDPPRPAVLQGRSPLKSPVPVERVVRRPKPDPPERPRPTPPPEVRPVERPVEPPPPIAKPDPVPPPVVAPVVSASADPRTQAGVLTPTAPPTPSQGSGNGGGAGSGSGTGLGEGTGAGIGDGSGAGTGGGPYRPGSGIVAPELLREVKPQYTEEARRRSLTGDVVLEIVVRSDGGVGAVKVLQGLGSGLDQRAIDAVRQWRFAPARRLGTPVDVLVEVAVEFRLR